ARQHLHRLPHRAALRHVPVRGLPARHPRPGARAGRAPEAGRRPDGTYAEDGGARAREGRGQATNEEQLSRAPSEKRATGDRRPATGDDQRLTPAVMRCCITRRLLPVACRPFFPDARQTLTAAPLSSWSSRPGSMLPPLIRTTVRRPRIALASS